MTRDLTDEVLALLAPHVPRRPFWALDWAVIETEVGHRLPTDYKRLCDHLPPGRFRDFLWLRHPLGSHGGGLLGEEAELIDTVRELAGVSEWENIPGDLDAATIPGLLYPCLLTDNGDTGYWLAAGDDPDAWTIVLHVGKELFSGQGTGLSELLHDFLTDEEFFGSVLSGDEPLFTSDL
ncbi:hypothetical protein ABGB18_04005 [Nonomuraea sp. B12E4]|uniref:hypothetical protein n=1 Tax=Nonomuraea sp. B12E4 TaxID=3153564 RepID=UPI00325D8A3F